MESKYTITSGAGGKEQQLFKAVRLSDEQKVLIKKISYANLPSKRKQQIIDDINLLTQIKCENILKYEDYYINKSQAMIYIVMEYCDEGNLEQYISNARREGRMLTEEIIWIIAAQLTLALKHIHSDGKEVILHRNICPAKVYVDSDKNIKLGDFNLAKKLDLEEQFATTRLTETYYQSPEQLENGIFTKKTDIWSLGCLIYQICTYEPPFRGKHQIEAAILVKETEVKEIKNYSRQLNRVIQWCLAKDPKQRPDVNDLHNIPEIDRRIRSKKFQQKDIQIAKCQETLRKREKKLEDQRVKFDIEKAQYLQREIGYESLKKRREFEPLKQCNYGE